MKNKHLSLNDRIDIEVGLKEGLSFKKIGENINKDCTTISREIRNHMIIKNISSVGRVFNNCVFRYNCPYKIRGILCNNNNCEHYKKEDCQKLSKPPYVCNGCKDRSKCTLTKHFYEASYAHNEYEDNLKESRSGISYTQEELNYLNKLLKPLIVEQKQSLHHIVVNNKNKMICSERELYILIDRGILDIRNIDLPRKVRFRQRRKENTYYKIDKKCLEGRRYQDFLKYMEENPDTPIVEIDSVEGVKGGKVLLTIHFVNCSFMLAFLREHNDAQSVIDIFNKLENLLTLDIFKQLFIVILTDNGTEFSNPSAIEQNKKEIKRCKVFYCEPGKPNQKGACEVNHELIRRVLPKGTSFDNLTQDDINKLMSHINSYKRKKLNNLSPLELFSKIYGSETAQLLGIKNINPNDIDLSDNLLNKHNK